jgi:hypothetical protein
MAGRAGMRPGAGCKLNHPGLPASCRRAANEDGRAKIKVKTPVVELDGMR